MCIMSHMWRPLMWRDWKYHSHYTSILTIKAVANHKREPIHLTKGLVFTLFRVAALNPWHLTMPLSGAHGSTYALSLSLSLCSCINHKNFTSVLQKTPYDWQNHPHAHIKITVKVISKTIPLVINNLAWVQNKSNVNPLQLFRGETKWKKGVFDMQWEQSIAQSYVFFFLHSSSWQQPPVSYPSVLCYIQASVSRLPDCPG